ncbi:hypothetical protein GIB67_013235 [Kingdonia uniflora]|uniref:ubiquitinyl hydrolase 1 n=1 Tax=Kingdonia uniflora TaxID=39325 RepID=A0A7J7NT87_9MAGN|nr:hypothetical protein GIB67_013235 [Kingdonia uniflora]
MVLMTLNLQGQVDSMLISSRCSVCGQESEASLKMEDFYELELNIKGLKSLDESLKDYLSMEELCGENQYFCESCKIRVDATRCIKLRTLPNVLNLQLKRCVFHPKTATKKKITSVFSFPCELDMGRRLGEPSELELVYDLSVVLVHRGTANSGHYVANIKDESTGKWWGFDDECVSMLGAHPFGESSSSSSVKPMQTDSIFQPSCSEHINSMSNRNQVDDGQLRSQDSTVFCRTESFSSADAYMLMYNRRSTRKGSEKLTYVELDEPVISESSNTSLPSHLYEEILELNASYANACEEYKLNKDRQLKKIIDRKQEVRSILNEAPVLSLKEPYFWIATDWLRQWADSINPPILDNTSIQCVHGRVPVAKVGSMKRLSDKAWTSLLLKCTGGPSLSSEDYCLDCLMDGAKTMIRSVEFRDQRATMKQIAEAALAGKFSDGMLYNVSKAWLLQWLRRKHVDSPREADVGATASITCPHGQLMPEQSPWAKRVLVPEYLWLFLLGSANALNPDCPSGCSAFPMDSETCARCIVQLSEVASVEDTLRSRKLKQRQVHEKLYSGKNIILSPGCKYYMLPSSWLTAWRSYITVSGKNMSFSAEPDCLEGTMNSLICEKTDGLTIITENDWNLFCEEWEYSESKSISAEIEVSSYGTSKSSEDMPNSEADLSISIDEDFDSIHPIIKTYPEICEDCIRERERCKLMQKLSYCNKEICVFLVHGKEAPRSVLEASGTISDRDRRSSKRSRKTRFGNSIALTVSGSTSVYELKMRLWQCFGVVKENQILHKGQMLIKEESATLADMNIIPGDVLWVRDSEVYENRDIAEELLEQKAIVQSAEEGFRGTLLTSTCSAQVT